ncbi:MULTISPECIES: paraquat-inducible protein A [Pseudomonas]|uniref:paraquat-inducible protein A n=1 Tax=Pseudomonas TaxID=286 RepID=UPI000D20EEE9|nr:MULTISPECIES: paraquat-inducible protein A [Pseudomonas]AVX88886.1 paraquat-inducible membrane protein A [Pseudomonas koreensis]MBI6948620.1 paraquat-inducible protein A [Pseudomonas koreensis]MCU7216392.1 paraquat-inducible protein A [Pseudomonas sp. VE 196-7]
MKRPATASELNLCLCHSCGLACDMTDEPHECPRCDAPLHRRKTNSLARTWAYLFAALAFYVPANLLPVMNTVMLGNGADSTIMSGVLEFWEGGAWDIALIIFIASIAVPGIKFVALSLLLITVQRGSDWARRERSKLYRFVELIGYWSMLDVLVVALVAALVKFQALGDIEPRPGILFFGMVVVFTMLSAMSFDPRLIWDNAPDDEPLSDAPPQAAPATDGAAPDPTGA